MPYIFIVITSFGALVNIDLPQPGTTSLTPILNLAFGILGAISFLVMTIAGVMLVASSGEPQRVARARAAILYSLVGLVVAILAAVIVNFILDKIS